MNGEMNGTMNRTMNGTKLTPTRNGWQGSGSPRGSDGRTPGKEAVMLTAIYARNTYRCLPDSLDPRERKG